MAALIGGLAAAGLATVGVTAAVVGVRTAAMRRGRARSDSHGAEAAASEEGAGDGLCSAAVSAMVAAATTPAGAPETGPTCVRMLPRGALKRVEATFVFLGVENYAFIERECPGAAAEAFAQLAHVVHTALVRSRGRQLACGDGSLLFVFPNPECALRGIFTAQREHAALPCSDALAHCRFCPTETAPSGSVLFRGLRVCVGLHHGTALTLARRTHGRTPRMFAGDAVLQAYRTACAARGGQVLLTAATHARCTRWLAGTAGIACTWLGAVDRTEAVWEVALARNSTRVYAPAPAHAGGWVFPHILGSALGTPASPSVSPSVSVSPDTANAAAPSQMAAALGPRARRLLMPTATTAASTALTRSTSAAVLSATAGTLPPEPVAVRGADPAHPVLLQRLDLAVLQRPDVRAAVLEARRELHAASLPPVLYPAVVH